MADKHKPKPLLNNNTAYKSSRENKETLKALGERPCWQSCIMHWKRGPNFDHFRICNYSEKLTQIFSMCNTNQKSKLRLASTCNIWKLQQLEKAVLLKDYTAEFVSTEIYSRPFLQWRSLEGFKIPRGSLFTLILYQDKTNTSWPWVFWKHTYTYFQGTKTLEETLQTWIKLHPAWWDLGNISSPENMAKWGMY